MVKKIITLSNVHTIKAPCIVEVANGPISTDADDYLVKNKKIIIPDILANVGGVTVSYFEWVQNKAGYYWHRDKVHDRLQSMITREFEIIYQISRNDEIDMRKAAYVHALNRLGKAVEAQGTRDYFLEK